MIPSSANMLSNLEKFAAAHKKLPNATHAYLRREDGVTVDIPIAQAEFTIRNKHKWTFENLAVSDVVQSPRVNPWPSQKLSDIGQKETKPAAPEKPVEVPPKPSEEAKQLEQTPAPAEPTTPEPSTDGQAAPTTDQKPAETATPAAPAAAPAQPARSTRSRAK